MNILRVGSITAGGNIILVTTDSGATVYAVSGGKVVSGVAVGGVAKLKVKAGTWRVWAELDGQQTSEVEVIVTDSYYKEMSFGMPLSSLAHGALVRLTENGKGVNFYLAKHDYESGLNGAGRSLMVRNPNYPTAIAWNGSGNTYASSSVHSWLNSTYKSMLDSKVQELIGSTSFYYTPMGGNRNVTNMSSSIFLLSLTELGLSDSYVNAEGSALPIASLLKIGSYNGSACEQHTRSPYKMGVTIAAVNTSGSASIVNVSTSYRIRPSFTLPAADVMVNPTPNADGSYTLMV